MHVSHRLALLCCLALISACAQTSDPTPVTDEEKALYEIGRQLSERLDFLEVTEQEVAFVAQGLEDGALGRQPQVDPHPCADSAAEDMP